MNWQQNTGTHRLNTLGVQEQVQTIKAGQTITKAGHTQGQRVKCQKRKERGVNKQNTELKNI